MTTNCKLFINNIRFIFRNQTKTIYYKHPMRRMSTTTSKEESSTASSIGLLSILEKNPKRLERIKFLGKLFNTNNHELRIAGGAVRDILMGVEPQDIDFATTARPEESLAILSKHEDMLRIILTAAGQKHGTVAVKFKEGILDFKKIKLTSSSDEQQENKFDKSSKSSEPEYDEENPFEITTLRRDTFTDGRHAEVQFVNDWRIDAERRDLTINAMFLTLDEGKLVDYFNGQSDLKNGIVKFVGSAELRIKEDYLRILRYFRFWSRYGSNNKPDAETLSTIKTNLNGLDIISGERIWQELKKILTYMPCSYVVELLLELNLFDQLGVVDSETDPDDYDAYTKQVILNINSVERNIQNYLKSVSTKMGDVKSISSEKRLKELLPVILFVNVIRSHNMCLNAHKRLKFSNLERDSIMYIIENRNNDITMEALKHQLVMIHAPERPQALIKIKALLIYKGLIELIPEIETWQVPTFPLTGTIVAQEIKKRKLPGNKIKSLLESLKIQWADSDYKLNENELISRLQEKCHKLENSN